MNPLVCLIIITFIVLSECGQTRHDTSSNNDVPPVTGPAYLDKLTKLRASLVREGQFTYFVDPNQVFKDARSHFQHASTGDLRKTPINIFENLPMEERSVYCRGNTGDIFKMLSQAMTDPIRGLFYIVDQVTGQFQINPKSDAFHEYEFVGRIFGMAILHDLKLDVHFVPSIFKLIQGEKLTLDDLEFVDPELHRGLSKIQSYNLPKELKLTMTITVSGPNAPAKDIEMIKDGKGIAVTDDNKQEYVDLYVEHVLAKPYQRQIEEIRKGIYHVIPVEWMQGSELGLTISGPTKKIGAEVLKRLATYEGDYNEESDVIIWFWECVSNWEDEQLLRNLLIFVTGSPIVRHDGNPRPFVIKEGQATLYYPNAHANDKPLPASRPQSNTLLLPAFTNKDDLCNTMTMVVKFCL